MVAEALGPIKSTLLSRNKTFTESFRADAHKLGDSITLSNGVLQMISFYFTKLMLKTQGMLGILPTDAHFLCKEINRN